jgi:hypothetical protein
MTKTIPFKIRFFFLLFTSIFSIVFFSPVFIHAQQLPQSVLDTISTLDEKTQQQINKKLSEIPTKEDIITQALSKDLEVKTDPIYPSPNEKVTATVVSNVADLNRADIFWYVNDKLEAKGKGMDEFEFSTKSAGDATIVDIVIKTKEGLRVDKKITINPIEMDIIWEAESYTPPFYKGKALLSPKTTQKIIAMPNFVTPSGKTIPANELIYKWREDGKVLKKKSGYGKYVYYTEAPYLFWDKKISVEVSSFGNSLKAYAEIKPKVITPGVVFYKDLPVEGVWYGDAVGQDFNLSDQEVTVKAEPYFFAKDDINAGDLKFNWSLNGKRVTGNNDKLTLRQEGGEGSARISVDIKNMAKTFQSARDSFLLNFRDSSLFN